MLGLVLTRWEATPRALHYTPNRFFVLAITLTIAGRVIYSLWRAWQTWGGAVDRREWLASWGPPKRSRLAASYSATTSRTGPASDAASSHTPAGVGILLTSTSDVSFSHVNLLNRGDDGIRGTSVNNLPLNACN